MKTYNPKSNFIATFIFSFVLAISLSSCSDDNEAGSSFDHLHDDEVTDMEKHTFEHAFAKQCVEREVRNSNDKAYDRIYFKDPCMCIARFMMEDLTAREAEKFLAEKKNTQSLRIRFENAAYNCLQKNSANKAKPPEIFKRR